MLDYRTYWNEVASVAAEVTAEAREHDRDISEVLWETIDGHEYVIYTAKAQAVLLHSQNDGALIEDCGGDAAAKDGVLDWSARAYWAMQRDVQEHEDFDVEEDDDED